MNRELLIKVRDKIAANPNEFDMSDWIAVRERGLNRHIWSWKDKEDRERQTTACGTVACIAGHTLLIACEKLTYNETWAEAAIKLLDIDEEQAKSLFYQGQWPEKFRDGYQSLTESELAVARINHMLETGE